MEIKCFSNLIASHLPQLKQLNLQMNASWKKEVSQFSKKVLDREKDLNYQSVSFCIVLQFHYKIMLFMLYKMFRVSNIIFSVAIFSGSVFFNMGLRVSRDILGFLGNNYLVYLQNVSEIPHNHFYRHEKQPLRHFWEIQERTWNNSCILLFWLFRPKSCFCCLIC